MKWNLSMISLFQYIFSVSVIIIHSGRLFESDLFHFLVKSVLAREAVPYFIVCTSFFLRSYPNGKIYKYFQSLTKRYFLWTLVYLPYGYIYFSKLQLSYNYIGVGVLVAVFYTGTCYHLWYIPALVFGWFFVQWVERLSGKYWALLVTFSLYCMGAMETYSDFVQHSIFSDLLTRYMSIFFTSRNGLFYVPIYIYVGCLLYDNYDSIFLKKYGKLCLGCSTILLCLESIVIYFNQGIDKNFILSSPIFIFFFFYNILRSRRLAKTRLVKLRQLSGHYYFLHPIFIEWGLFLLKNSLLHPHERGLLVFLFSLFTSHVVAELLILFPALGGKNLKNMNENK